MKHHALLIAALAAIVSALLSLLSGQAWLADLASHFRLHYVVGITLLLWPAIALRSRLAALLLAVALGFHLYALVMFEGETIDARSSTSRNSTSQHSTTQGSTAIAHFTLLVTNLKVSNRDYSGVAGKLRELDADAIIVVELTPPMQAHLATAIDYPYYHGIALPGANGVGIFSRLPFLDRELPDFNVPATPALRVVQEIAGTRVQLVGVHPLAPMTPTMYAARNRQFAGIAQFAREQSGALVIAGDFNSTPWSNHFRQLLEQSGLDAAHHQYGLKGTWPGCTPLLSIPIDHVLTSGEVRVTSKRVVEIPGSDHCGLLLDLEINH
ncbi:MAG: endonuclease/exonuclease/phosphatase family protein [Gammaproteobacteria bacterium]|nr:endonuclease/exonuclease/phosphatase family protein [Gammaproteobacteria bacterium]